MRGQVLDAMATHSALSTDEAHTSTLISDAVHVVEAASTAPSATSSVVLLVVAIAGAYFFVFRRAARAARLIGGSERVPLPLGTRVRLQGLVAKPEYNGRTARIIDSVNESGRYAVEIEPLPAENLKNAWQPRTKLLLRPASLQREEEEGTPEPLQAATSDEECPRCLEAMPPLTWRGDERNRAVCCGGQMCKSCWTASLRRREELSRRVAALKQQPRASVDPVAARELLEELERSDKCDLCRAAAPHSPEASCEAVRRHAEAGRSWAMYMLGNKYQTGAGVRADQRLAFEWFQRAATHPQPHPNASQALGSVYLAGAGVRADPKEALRWLLPAAEAGHATAMHNLGQMYSEGLGVRRDAKEAARWWLRGAEAGSHQCQSDLGCCYENGEGVARSDAEASRWFLAAAEQGNATAQFNVGGALFRQGQAQGRPELCREAVTWCRKSAAQGNSDAMQMLRQLQP